MLSPCVLNHSVFHRGGKGLISLPRFPLLGAATHTQGVEFQSRAGDGGVAGREGSGTAMDCLHAPSGPIRSERRLRTSLWGPGGGNSSSGAGSQDRGTGPGDTGHRAGGHRAQGRGTQGRGCRATAAPRTASAGEGGPAGRGRSPRAAAPRGPAGRARLRGQWALERPRCPRPPRPAPE